MPWIAAVRSPHSTVYGAEPPFPWVSLWIPLIPLLLLNTQADHILAITGALSFTDRYHWWFLLTHTSCLCCSCPTLLHYYKLLLSFAILCLIFKHCRLTFGLSHDSSLQSLDLWGQSQWVPLQARRTPSKAGHLKPALTSASRLLTEQRDHLWLLGKESSQHVECCTSVGPVIEDVLLWFMVCARCLLFLSEDHLMRFDCEDYYPFLNSNVALIVVHVIC